MQNLPKKITGKVKETETTSESAKEEKTHSDVLEWRDQNTAVDKSDNTHSRYEFKNIGERKKKRPW